MVIWRWILNLLPLFFIVAVVLGDMWIPFPTFTPVLASLALIVIASRCPPIPTILWAVLYSMMVSLIFLNPKVTMVTNWSPFQDPVTPYLRCCQFYLVALLSIYLSFSITRMRISDREKTELLRMFKDPVITSDKRGKILYMNEAASRFFGFEVNESQWRSYFDLIKVDEFDLSEEYFKLITGSGGHSLLSTSLRISKNRVKGSLKILESTKRKIVVTILYIMDNKDLSI